MSIEKTNIPGYVKETRMNCIINTNLKEYKAFQAEKKRILRLKNLEEELNQMKILIQKLAKE